MPTPEQVAAALVSPWPTWWVEAEDEPDLLARLEAFGPLPQTDLFEPWDEGDPWRARVLFPPLDQAAALLAHGELEDGHAPGFTEWLDRGRITEDRLTTGRFHASLFADAEQGGQLIPALEQLGTSPLQAELSTSQAGSTAQQVRHRTTGRRGLLVSVPVPEADPVQERQAVLELVTAHLAQAEPGYAPDLRWWSALGRVHLLAWSLQPARRTLPRPRLHLGPCHLERWSGRIELQVAVPLEEHEEQVLELSKELAGLELSGDRSRWIDGVLHATWSAPAGTPRPPVDLPHRWLPGCPEGLEEAWLGVDPEWWSASGRCFVRYHCSLRDRDLLPVLTERRPDPLDLQLAHTLSAFGSLEPVQAGHAALRLRVPTLDDAGWQTLVEVLGALPEPAIGPVIPVRMQDRTTLLLERVDLPREPSLWSPR